LDYPAKLEQSPVTKEGDEDVSLLDILSHYFFGSFFFG